MSFWSYSIFFAVIALTLYITYWAAKQTRTASEFYTAGGSLTGWQNGMAIAGDYLSAASFLGIAGAISLNGFDGFYYSIGWLTAYLVVLFLIAEPLRNLGKYTMADMIGSRFGAKKVRGAAALNTITIVLFYMLAQLVGAGALIKLLFGIEYWISVLIVGVMMMIYVLFGGMTATSWVQIIKAILLMVGTIVISFLVLMKFNFNFVGMFDLMRTATPHGESFLHSGVVYKDPIGLISVLLALVLGTAGLPHILMRFFTVKDAKTARSSVVYAVWIIGIFYVMTIFLGFGAAKFVGRDAIIAENSAGNMAAPMLAGVLGGDMLESFVAAVAFATILAVVAGLVLSGASAIAHDIYAEIFKKGKVTEKQQVRSCPYCSNWCFCRFHFACTWIGKAECRVPRLARILYRSVRERSDNLVHNLLAQIQYDWCGCFHVNRTHYCPRSRCSQPERHQPSGRCGILRWRTALPVRQSGNHLHSSRVPSRHHWHIYRSETS